MLISLKNAGIAGLESVSMPYSNLKHAIAACLVKEGFIKSASKKMKHGQPALELELAYDGKKPKVSEIKRISKPSRRMYQGVKEIRSVRSGYGLVVLSTPKGILTGKDAKKEMVGGEVLFEVW